MTSISLPRFTKFQAAIHIAAWIPLVLLVYNWMTDNLTFNPIQAAELRTGKYALVLLILALACTPLNTVFGFRQAIKVRRALGLYAFMYASIHFLIFIGIDYQFDLVLLEEAIFEKIDVILGKLRNETHLQMIEVYTKVLLNCLEILNRIPALNQ